MSALPIPHEDDDFPFLYGGEGNASPKACPYIQERFDHFCRIAFPSILVVEWR